MSSEISHFNSAPLPENPTGPLYDESQRLQRLFSTYSDVLKREADIEDVKGDVIPEFEFTHKKGRKFHQGKAYFFRSPTEHNIISGYLQSDLQEESTGVKLRLDIESGLATTLDGNSFEDSNLLALAVNGAEVTLGRLQHQRNERIREQRQRRRRRGIGLSVAAASLTALGTAGYFVYDYFTDRAEQQAAARKAFDESNYQIAGEPFGIGESKLGVMSEVEFNKVPDYKIGDSLNDARRVTIDVNGCTKLPVEIGAGDVFIAAKKTDPNRHAPLALGKTENDLYICGVGERPAESTENSLDLAVQVRKNQS